MIGSLPAIGYYNQGVGSPSATAYQALAAYPTALFGPSVSPSYGSYGSYGVQTSGQLSGYLGSYGSSYNYAQVQYGGYAQQPYAFPYGNAVQPYGWTQQPTYTYSPITDTYNSQQLWQNPYLTGNPTSYQNCWNQYGSQNTGYPPVAPPNPPPAPPPTPPSPPVYQQPPPPPQPPTPPPCPPADPPANTYVPTPPVTGKPPLDPWASFEGGTVNYPALNPLSITTDFKSAAEVVKLRLIGGDAGDVASLTMNGGDPRSNADGRALERTTIYNTLQSNQRLRYNIDSKCFVETFPDGTTRNIASLEHMETLSPEVDPKKHIADLLAASDAKFPPWFPGGKVPAGSSSTTNPLAGSASFERGSVQYPPLNALSATTDFQSASDVMQLRLIGGTGEQRGVYTFHGQDPRSNSDGKMAERLAVYGALQTSDRLRFNVDKGTFVLTYPDGATRELDSLDHMLATGKGGGPALADHVRALIAQSDAQIPPWTFGLNHTAQPYEAKPYT